MKQKIVIRLQMNENKGRSKAMKIAVGRMGALSVSIQGKDGDQILVIGEGVDPVNLTTILRKKMGFAELVSVAAVEEKNPDGKQADKKPETKTPAAAEVVFVQPPWTTTHGTAGVPPPYYPYEYHERNDDPCRIM